MAQVLDRFEEEIENQLPKEAAGAVADFKGLVRARMNALAVDAIDIFSLDDVAHNELAQEFKDALDPVGRP